MQRELVAAPRWIIDGNYAATVPIRLRAADTVLFLDLPGWTCLLGIAQRQLRHGGGQQPAGGEYNRITRDFARYIAGYRRAMAPRVRALIAEHAGGAHVVILRSRRAPAATWPQCHRRWAAPGADGPGYDSKLMCISLVSSRSRPPCRKLTALPLSALLRVNPESVTVTVTGSPR